RIRGDRCKGSFQRRSRSIWKPRSITLESAERREWRLPTRSIWPAQPRPRLTCFLQMTNALLVSSFQEFSSSPLWTPNYFDPRCQGVSSSAPGQLIFLVPREVFDVCWIVNQFQLGSATG